MNNSNGIRKLARAMAGAACLCAAGVAVAHHPVTAKFDRSAEATLQGVVSSVDWRNPHAHVFVTIDNNGSKENWAVELESPVVLKANGWSQQTLQPGDHIEVRGISARDGSRQIWGQSVRLRGSNKEVFSLGDTRPIAPNAKRSTPRWDDGRPALGAVPGTVDGYWGYPSETVLVEEGVDVAVDRFGLLKNPGDAERIAPFQPWSLALFEYRQQRELQDDPMFINCKPPGGPRQFQQDLGFQLIEDREKERVFVLMGSGNRNYRILYLDDRSATGQVLGDDDNPLYYGRSVGEWEGDTLVVNTTGFNEDFWFSNGGLPHTSQLELTEKFSRPDLDTLVYEVTVDDPGAYTRPWTASWTLQWVGGEELPAHYCQNNRP